MHILQYFLVLVKRMTFYTFPWLLHNPNTTNDIRILQMATNRIILLLFIIFNLILSLNINKIVFLYKYKFVILILITSF